MATGQNARSAWPSNDDFTFLSLAVVVIGLAVLGWLGWIHYHGEISAVVAWVAHWQIRIVHHFTPALDGLDQTIAVANMELVTIPEILAVLNRIGFYLRIPVIVFILLLAGFCFTCAAPSQFVRRLDLDSLIAEQAQFFRAIAAYARRNLRLVPMLPDALRPSDPALHVAEWVARLGGRFNGKPSTAGDLDQAAAVRALTRQLGPVWNGAKAAPGHARVLYAAFTLHLEQKRAEAADLLGALAEALPPGEREDTAGPVKAYAVPADVVARADAVLGTIDLRRQADSIAAAHAYTAPALMSVLTAARRKSGVLAPAQFACLKLIDRSLWYALHSLGFEGDGPGQMTHPTPRIEAAGARDHWAAERLAGRPLIIPSIDRAFGAVRAAIGQDEGVTNSPEAL